MENFELSDCVYEHIKDTFYYGLFGDFKLVIDTKTGYFNATKLCVEGGKEYRIWSRSERSNKLFQYYEKLTVQLYGQLSYEVKLQNNDILNKQVTGTYVPKELILDIASWISIEFYDKCNNIIINYLFMGKVQCELQLSIQESKGKEKNYYSFSHFIYELTRGKFGIIS